MNFESPGVRMYVGDMELLAMINWLSNNVMKCTQHNNML